MAHWEAQEPHRKDPVTEPRITDDQRPLRPPTAEMKPPRQHGWVVPAIIAAVVAFPLFEVAVLIRSGQAIGFGRTVLLMIATSALGAWLAKREGGRAWRALAKAFESGRMPSDELADGALILVGGVLLLLPGFVSDVAGLIFLLPFTRPLARRALAYAFARQGGGGLAPRPIVDPSRGATDPTIVPGEVVEGDVVSGDVEDATGAVIHREILR